LAGRRGVGYEKRVVSTDIDWLLKSETWAGMKSIVQYRCYREEKGVESICDRFYISSLDADAQTMAQIICNQWSIENRLHWVLDVTFGEDACWVRKRNAPENLNIMRKAAINLISNNDEDRKKSTKSKMFKASLDQDYLSSLLFKSK
jgi:predicted transposase YbfD/YdcC